ncbi:hypothetical protein Bca52824_067503 [Brassica carinata]|uniref:Agenet domain-containing protein n=1 Tax=Brassica carinata TaxID=52824 RepID=A0A8X7QMP9_BRACI|nr:hypothetical protein Bca52824_067503 [Brassica carinata]
MVEVWSVKDKTWYPTLLVKKIKEDDEIKYIVKDFNNRLRPALPPSSYGAFESMERVEALLGSGWCRGLVMKLLSEERYRVRLDVNNKEYVFKHSELRPLMVWENGVWRDESKQKPVKETPSNILNKNPMHSCSGPKPLTRFKTVDATAELRKKKKADVVTSDKTPAIVTTPTATPLEQTKAKTVGNTSSMKTPEPVMNLNDFRNDSAPHKTHEEEKSRKRKRELLSADQSLSVVKKSAAAATCIEETPARDNALIDLPFPKMVPYWKTCESSDGFKSVPQRPHFRPLLESVDDLFHRESAAVGMMMTFYDLLDEVKGLKLDDSTSRLNYLWVAFAKLEQHGFEVEAYQAVISKVLSLKDVLAKKEEEQKCFEDDIKEEENASLKLEETRLELQRKISELERQDADVKKKKETAEKKIADIKAHAGMISQEIEDVKLEFQKTILVPW